MCRCVGIMWLLTVVLGAFQPALARPEYLAKFQADPFRRAGVDGCRTCHVADSGGGARNAFGSAFEAAAQEITPMLRASFPQQFTFETAKLPDGSTFSFSDPESKFVVFERQNQRVLVDVAALSAPQAVPVPVAENRMSFFVTSEAVGNGQLGGLAGADRRCQELAKAAGAGDRTWRAYLSTSFQDRPAANAGDRIGGGPWYNAKGVLLARGPADLHTKDHLRPEVVLTERGDMVGIGGGQAGAHLDVLTGSLPNGTAAIGKNCNNWTSAAEGEAMVGEPGVSWNSSHPVRCGPTTAEDATLQPRLYCFAAK